MKKQGIISQSYTTSRDGITCPGKCRSQFQSHCRSWQMLAKSWTGKYFPVGGAQLVVHFANSAFEMAHEFTRFTFPSRFTIPPASLDPSLPRPRPYLFNGGGMQNLQCSAIYASRISPQHIIITRIFHKFRWKQRKQSDRRTCHRNRCSTWSDAEISFGNMEG